MCVCVCEREREKERWRVQLVTLFFRLLHSCNDIFMMNIPNLSRNLQALVSSERERDSIKMVS